MKLDLKKERKALYTAKATPCVVQVPKQIIISIEGKGNPNTSQEFKDAVAALYPVAYKIKFSLKAEGKDFSVMPLEGLWWMENMNEFSVENKDNWLWKIFLVQPDFVTEKHFSDALEITIKNKNLPLIDKMKYEILEEGSAAQVMYIGSYSNEGPTINAIHEFIKNSGHKLDKKHHEIYLSDMRKVAPDKLKTIIRQPFK